MRRVLAGLDLTQSSDGFIDALSSLRGLGIEEIVLAHVTHKPSPVPAIYSTDPTRGVGPELVRINRSLDGRFSVELSILSGDPAAELAKEAEVRRVDAIVLGSSARSRMEEIVAGRTVWDVVRRTHLPVLSIPLPPDEGGGPTTGPGWILHATDFSECASTAFSVVSELAVGMGLPVRLLHVLDENRPGNEAEAKRRLSALAEKLVEAGATQVQQVVKEGSPWEEILAAAGSEEGSLVVMGTHGRGFLPEVIPGSQSREVIRHGRCPVLLVPSGGATSSSRRGL
jgi:nucleotide-binding universal stress UspA family protein